MDDILRLNEVLVVQTVGQSKISLSYKILYMENIFLLCIPNIFRQICILFTSRSNYCNLAIRSMSILQSTLVISNSKGLIETLRDIQISVPRHIRVERVRRTMN